MCEIINFPQDQKDRVEKIKHLLEKKNKSTAHKKQPIPNAPPPKQHTTITAVTNLQLTGITDLTKTLSEINDSLKYVTDCFYDLTMAIYKLKIALLLIIFVVIVVSSVGAVIFLN
jgi:hypothetical protein